MYIKNPHNVPIKPGSVAKDWKRNMSPWYNKNKLNIPLLNVSLIKSLPLCTVPIEKITPVKIVNKYSINDRNRIIARYLIKISNALVLILSLNNKLRTKIVKEKSWRRTNVKV